MFHGPLSVAGASTQVTPTPTVSISAELVAARSQLDTDMDGVDSLISMAQGQAPAALVTTLSQTLSAAISVRAGNDPAAIDAAARALQDAKAAVVAARADWWAQQQRTATPTPTPVVTPTPTPTTAPKVTAKASATPKAAPAPAAPAPVVVEAPHQAPVAVVNPDPAPASPNPATSTAPSQDADAYLVADLASVGATWVAISYDWATVCHQTDDGPRYIQGCAITTSPATIFMKPMTAQFAATVQARGVVLHEYSHLLQYKLGYYAVRDATDPIFGVGHGIEYSADCMAIALGAQGAPGGYTSDCSGQRGTIAAAMLAGRLS